jgi:hypothetical protein
VFGGRVLAENGLSPVRDRCEVSPELRYTFRARSLHWLTRDWIRRGRKIA